jgi:uncharacterized ion transporter superfamily protein YfcC
MFQNKIIIQYFVNLFMIIFMFLFFLLFFYYILPNNYYIYDIDTNDKIINSSEFVIQKNEEKIIKYNDYKDNKLGFINDNSECINLIITNNLKSENVKINKNKLIKLINSDIIIKNNTPEPLNIKINIY